MEQFLTDAKKLVHRLNSHDNDVDMLIGEATNLQNKLIAMRQYHDEVNKMNDHANHRPRSTLILGSQLENQRIQNLEQENRELSLSLAEHQSALELIMNKYREQVVVMMHANTSDMMACQPYNSIPHEDVAMKEKILEMASIMKQSAQMDEDATNNEIEMLRSLQVENENLRELLEISGGKPTTQKYNFKKIYSDLNVDIELNGDKGMLPLQETKKEMKLTDSGIYETEKNFADSLKMIPPIKAGKNKRYYDSLDKLFSKEENDHSTDDHEQTDNFFSIPDNSNFRGIITDIKPFEGGFDTEKGTSEETNEPEVENLILFDAANATPAASSVLSETLIDDNESLLQNLCNNNKKETPCSDKDDGSILKPEIQDLGSSISEVHQITSDSNVKYLMEGDAKMCKETTSDIDDVNVTSTIEETPSSQTSVEDNLIDEFEAEMMKSFVSSVDTAQSTDSNDMVDDNENESSEISALKMLNLALDFDDADYDDTVDDSDRDDDDDDDDDDDEEYVDEIMENESSDEEDANNEFSFQLSSNVHNEENYTGDVESPSQTINNEANLPNGKIAELKKSDIHNKNILNKKANTIEANVEVVLSNGEISDAESDLTVTGDDITEAMADFDSILDDACTDDDDLN